MDPMSQPNTVIGGVGSGVSDQGGGVSGSNTMMGGMRSNGRHGVMSPRRTLTAASSSGSDPLASPSNELISDIDEQTAVINQSLYAGVLAAIPGGLLSLQRCISTGAALPNAQGPGALQGAWPGAGVASAGAWPAAGSGALGAWPGTEPGGIQAQLLSLEKQYQRQKDMLNRQFEEQRKILEQEQQAQMHEYIKRMMLQKKQEEMLIEQQQQQQRKNAGTVSTEEERGASEGWEQLKHKRKDKESAVASTAVKLKLRECLLNKSHRELRNSGDSSPESRQWSSTQHSSLEQSSPPTTTDWSPPPQNRKLLNKFDEDYPLRKTVSEPSLKMRNFRLSLRQKVIQRNTQLTRRRENYRKRVPLTVDHDDSPGTPPTVVSSQCSSIDNGLLIKQEPGRLGRVASEDGGANSEDGGGASEDGGGSNNSNPDISVGGAALRRHLMEQRGGGCGGKPSPPRNRSSHLEHNSSSHPYHMYSVGGGGAMGGEGMGGLHYVSPAESSSLTEAYVQTLLLARSVLPRTRSEPIPLPVQLLLQQHQLAIQKQQEHILRENNKLYLRQKLLHNSSVKKLMENVDESVESKLIQARGARADTADSSDIIVDSHHGGLDPPTASFSSSVHPPGSESMNRAHHKVYLSQMRARTLSGGGGAGWAGGAEYVEPETTDMAGGSEPGQRGCTGLETVGRQGSLTQITSKRPHKTAVDSVFPPMGRGESAGGGGGGVHPENPARLSSIWNRLEQTGLVDKCAMVKSRRATREELQTCHSEDYVQMYASCQRRTDPLVFEQFLSRFCRLPCGGIGVDADTVWNEQHTTMASRVAAGSVIEMSFKVALDEVTNGFALVRPPGHHAEDTQAMGFCYFNSIGVATKLLRDRLKLKRILIVDWDVHHGNSTQQLFYADPRVLYISLHRHDDGNFFPGTGFPSECGIERGLGYNVNISWSGAFMGDAEYLAAFRSIVMPIAREYQPELVLVSAGFDAAAGHPNPLGGYSVSPECFGYMTQQLMTLSEGGKVVLVLEGGYEILPLVNSAEQCVRALLREKIDLPAESELRRSPCKAAIETLANTVRHQILYWPCLARYTQSLTCSYAECQQRRLNDDVDTVSAFAGLSVISSGPSSSTQPSSTIQDRPDSTTTDIAEEQEPMDDG